MRNISEKMASTNMEAIQMLEDLAKNVYGGFEELVWLNLSAAKASFAESCRRSQTLLSAKDAREWLMMQTEMLRLPRDDNVAHVQQLVDVVFGVHSEFAKSMDTMLAAFNKAMNVGQIGSETTRNSVPKKIEVLKAD